MDHPRVLGQELMDIQRAIKTCKLTVHQSGFAGPQRQRSRAAVQVAAFWDMGFIRHVTAAAGGVWHAQPITCEHGAPQRGAGLMQQERSSRITLKTGNQFVSGRRRNVALCCTVRMSQT